MEDKARQLIMCFMETTVEPCHKKHGENFVDRNLHNRLNKDNYDVYISTAIAVSLYGISAFSIVMTV